MRRPSSRAPGSTGSRGVDIDELPGIGRHLDDPDEVERVAAAIVTWLRRREL